MRKSSFIVLCLLCIVGVLGCSEDEISEPEVTKEDTWYWGYFDGYVGSNHFTFENERYGEDTYVRTIRSSISDAPIDGMYTTIRCAKDTLLFIGLRGLEVGVRDVTTYAMFNLEDSYIQVCCESGAEDRCFNPRTDNPFRVEIFDVMWKSPWHPIVEVKLEGTLYNEDNPQDSICIEAQYGARIEGLYASRSCRLSRKREISFPCRWTAMIGIVSRCCVQTSSCPSEC